VGRKIYKNGEYEPEISNYLSNHIVFIENDISLDIGANIGWYSILLHKLMPASGTVYCFEPDPLNYELLASNIKDNGASNVIAVNNALSNKREIKKLYRYSNKNLGKHSLLDINSDDSIDIEALVLDEFIETEKIDFTRVKLAKIDIEGYELFALLGATKVLKNLRCLICEFEPEHMINGGVEPAALISLLEDAGFTANLIYDSGLVAADRESIFAHAPCDIIWIK
jgi:FkbM family methyltransferase